MVAEHTSLINLSFTADRVFTQPLCHQQDVTQGQFLSRLFEFNIFFHQSQLLNKG